MRAIAFFVLTALVATLATTACDRDRRGPRSPRHVRGDGGPEDDDGYMYRVDGGPPQPAPSITAAPGDVHL